MSDARQEHDWTQTAAIAAEIRNVKFSFFDTRKKPTDPYKLNPMVKHAPPKRDKPLIVPMRTFLRAWPGSKIK